MSQKLPVNSFERTKDTIMKKVMKDIFLEFEVQHLEKLH